jgi:two-component system nitrate/nitrite response regulator NarL
MKKIMIVDDVEISNFIMKKMISKVSSGNEIFDYTMPEKALADIEKINPDIIFLDLNMPAIDGWEFLKIMEEKNLRNTVYILTSSTSELDLQRSKTYSNVTDFLIKPVEINALATVLNSIL